MLGFSDWETPDCNKTPEIHMKSNAGNWHAAGD